MLKGKKIRKRTTSIFFSKNGMAPAQGWAVRSVLPRLQWGAPIPPPHHSSDGLCLHVGAQSSPEHKRAMGPKCREGREGIDPGSHSVWGSAHLYLGEAWDMWPLQLHISVEGSRQLPSFSWTTAGYSASGMCIVSSGRNHHIKWVSLPHMEIFSQWSFWAT